MSQKKAYRGTEGLHRFLFIVVGIIFVGFIVNGCSGGSSREAGSTAEFRIPPGGEARGTLSPAFFSGKISGAYKIAREIPDLLDKVWCYCDCEINSGHKSLKTCYTTEHAAYCDICMNEAFRVNELHKKGYSIEEIRKVIHREFSS